MEQFYANMTLNGVGGFNTGNPYWSSTEADMNNARPFGFNGGNTGDFLKSFDFYVRAVRAF